jgi:lipoprotein NlpD
MAIKKAKIFSVLIFIAIMFACGSPYGIYHTVQKCQTLYRISKSYNVPVEELMKVNNIDDPSSLKIGEKIFIPGAEKELVVESYCEQMTAEPETKSDKNKTIVEKKRENIKYDDKNIPSFSSFIWPVRGKIFSRFEQTKERKHDGIDISAPEGTPIKASAGGRVIYSGSGIRDYGNIIIIKHSENYFSVYAHNRENHVLEGDIVKQGQIIGKVGQTGKASGPHLHFEIRKGKTPIDPLKLLP